MTLLPGYSIKLFAETTHSVIYKGTRNADSKPVVIKVLSNEYPSSEELNRFEHEYELLKLLNGNGTVQIYGLEKFSEKLAIIEEDGGETLQTILKTKKLEILEFLTLSLKIVKALEKIHQFRIIHKDINPANIVIDNENNLKIIDFNMATTIPREIAEIRNPELLQEGTLLYISPEQTGRMNRGIDYRTDYYSLGIIFYQMVTGILPFQSTDMGEIIHAHIAKLPIAPNEINPTLPEIISELILKLMSKRAEDRYQSTYGLKYDLQKILDQLMTTGNIVAFPLGKKDISSRFQVPEKLYGREEAFSYLLNSFNEIIKGKVKLDLVAGYSGVGKSTLVHELYKPLLEKNGYFISGKFDQYKRNIPYTAIIQAVEEFIRQIMTENEDKLNLWRAKIQKALSPNGKVLTDIIAMLTTIIGEQPAIATLDSTERENRFKIVFRNFIQTIAGPDHPLVIFLDDCQWADFSSLDVLENLLLDTNTQYIMIILAYRDNQISQGDILSSFLNQLKKSNVFYNVITLPALQPPFVEQLIADTLSQDINKIKPLAEICYEKTQGNPFFLNQFLQTLYSEKLIEFNTEEGAWYWDIKNIEQKNITNNVIELMSQNIKKLPADTQRALALAACLGNKFDLQTLALILKKTVTETFKDLSEALKVRLISPSYDAYQFLHDRIQQAAYLLIRENERALIHLSIGRLLLQNTEKEKIADNIFVIVNHLNVGIALVTDEKEKLHLAELNLQAGKKAKNSIAFNAAYDYFKTGINLLGDTAWEAYYDLTQTLYIEIVEAAYLANEIKAVEELNEIALAHTKDLLNKVKLYQIKQRHLLTQHKITESTQVGLFALKLLGIEFPKRPNNLHVILSLLKTKWMLRGKTTDDLYHLPEMTDPLIQEAILVMIKTTGSSSVNDPQLTGLLVLKAIQLYLTYGNCREYSGFYSYYGLILGQALKQYDLGYQFCQLAMRLVEHFQSNKEKSYIWMMAGLVLPWKEKVENVLPLLIKAYQKGLETGSIEGTVYSAMTYAAYAFNFGMEINQLIQELQEMQLRNWAYQSHKTEHQYAAVLMQTLLNLSGRVTDVTLLKGEACDETEMFNLFNTAGDSTGILILHRCKLILGYTFNDFALAYQAGKEMIKYSHLDQVIYSLACVYIYYVLTCLNYFPNLDKSEQKLALKNINKIKNDLKIWSTIAPMNFLNKYYLIQAELANFYGRKNEAEDLYERSIALAKENHFISEEAIANEQAARFYLASSRQRIAKIYLQEAYYCYNKWGAFAKAKQLERDYPQFLKDKRKQASLLSAGVNRSLSHTTTATSMTDIIDLSSIMKASQVITQEIELGNLLTKLMQIVMENAGAERGFLLMEKSHEWYIEASIGENKIEILKSIPIKNILPENIIRYVIRSKTVVSLSDAIKSEQFATDAYIQKVKPKSVLCMPLLNQGVLSCILYLENNLATDVFTQNRLDLLTLLSSQVISNIDNARLYKHLKELNRAQESFVPKEFLQLLEKKRITDIKLGDLVQKEMTVMFCDIRNFTSLSEKLTPKDTMTFVNQFFNQMEPIISTYHGVIDKYIGDAIMALFPGSADQALQCAISMLKTLKTFNDKRVKEHPDADIIRIGIGLNTGLLVLGTIGTAHRMEGTVLSDAVNVASRTEALNKEYHTSLLITADTYKKLKDPSIYHIRKIAHNTQIKGKQISVSIYEVLEDESHLTINQNT